MANIGENITQELADRGAVICVKCGHVFEYASSIHLPCPFCGTEKSLLHIFDGRDDDEFPLLVGLMAERLRGQGEVK